MDYWSIIALGIVFAIAIIFTYVLEGDFLTMVSFISVGLALMVYAGVIDLWILILSIIANVALLVLKFKGVSGGLNQ